MLAGRRDPSPGDGEGRGGSVTCDAALWWGAGASAPHRDVADPQTGIPEGSWPKQNPLCTSPAPELPYASGFFFFLLVLNDGFTCGRAAAACVIKMAVCS